MKEDRTRSMGKSVRFVAALFAAAALPMTSHPVLIDLTGATPIVTGPTTLHIEGIQARGGEYWANFEWQAQGNVFTASDYGLMENIVFSEDWEQGIREDCWSTEQGSPMIENGWLTHSSNHSVLLTHQSFVIDCGASVSMMWNVAGGAGLVRHVLMWGDSPDHVLIGLGADNENRVPVLTVQMYETGEYVVGGDGDPYEVSDGVHTVAAAFDDVGQLRVSLDGSEIAVSSSVTEGIVGPIRIEMQDYGEAYAQSDNLIVIEPAAE